MGQRYLIGIGNETMTDDGVGPRIVEALSDRAREFGFETVVTGHDTAGILAYFEEATERILFVDCVRMGKRPGDWVCFTPGDVESRKTLDRLTTHEGDLVRIVEMARQLGCPMPPIAILGVQPERIEPGLELSRALQMRFAEYTVAAIDQMRGG